MPSKLSRRALPMLFVLVLLLAIAVPPAASALEFKIVNESGRSPEEVFVTVLGEPATYDVPDMPNNEPVKLSTIPGEDFAIDKLISGRSYLCGHAADPGRAAGHGPQRQR